MSQKSITLARILPKSLKVRLNDGPTAIFIMNMMSLGRILKIESKRRYSNFVMSWQNQTSLCSRFTSGGVISVAIGKLLELSPNRTFALNWAITNTSLTTLRLVGNEAQVLSLNEHHFIKAERPDLLTWI